MLATAMLTAALAGILALYSTILVMNKTSGDEFAAMGHAQYVMEDIRNTDFVNITSRMYAGDWAWGQTEITNEGLVPLNNEQIYSMVSGSDPLDLDVMVTWMDGSGNARSLTLQTRIASP